MSATPYPPATCSEEVVISRPGAALHTTRVRLLPNGHPRLVTQSQQMTSFSPSQLKSELTWFPSTTPPLRLTGCDCCQPTLTTSADTNDSSVGRQANGAVVCSWVFKSDTTYAKMICYSAQGQLLHYSLHRKAGREREICDRFLFLTAAKVAVKFVWRRTKHGGPVVQLPVRLVQTYQGGRKTNTSKIRWQTLLFHISNHSLKMSNIHGKRKYLCSKCSKGLAHPIRSCVRKALQRLLYGNKNWWFY